jgi:hypothetical protein
MDKTMTVKSRDNDPYIITKFTLLRRAAMLPSLVKILMDRVISYNVRKQY